MFAARSLLLLSAVAVHVVGADEDTAEAEHSCTKFIDEEQQYCHALVEGTQSEELTGAAFQVGLDSLKQAANADDCAERCQAIGAACGYAQWSHAADVEDAKRCTAFTKCWTTAHSEGALHTVYRCVAEPVDHMQWTKCTKPAVFTPPAQWHCPATVGNKCVVSNMAECEQLLRTACDNGACLGANYWAGGAPLMHHCQVCATGSQGAESGLGLQNSGKCGAAALAAAASALAAVDSDHSCTRFIDEEARYCHIGSDRTSVALAGDEYQAGLNSLRSATTAAQCAARCQAIGSACEYVQWSHGDDVEDEERCKAFTKCWTKTDSEGTEYSVFRCVAEPVAEMQWTQCATPQDFTPPTDWHCPGSVGKCLVANIAECEQLKSLACNSGECLGANYWTGGSPTKHFCQVCAAGSQQGLGLQNSGMCNAAALAAARGEGAHSAHAATVGGVCAAAGLCVGALAAAALTTLRRRKTASDSTAQHYVGVSGAELDV